MTALFRILLDEGVPESLRHRFSSEFAVETVRFRGWSGKRNGDLISAAEPHFDVLITVDKKMRYQQNVSVRDLRVVVLDAKGTTVDDLTPLLPNAEQSIRTAEPGQVIVVR